MRKNSLFLAVLLMSISIVGCKKNNNSSTNSDSSNIVSSSSSSSSSQASSSSQTSTSSTSGSESIVEKVTVLFDYNGGTKKQEDSTSVIIDKGSTIAYIPTPTKQDFTFGGWFNGDIELTTSLRIYEDCTFVARWDPIEAQGYKITFNKDEHVKLVVYQDKACTIIETSDTYYSRNKADGAIGKTDAQINFSLEFSDGYELDSITFEQVGNAWAGNIKYPNDTKSDTNRDDCYRVTKIGADGTVKITSKVKYSTPVEEKEGFEGVFVTDNHVQVLVYQDKACTLLEEGNEYLSRNKADGAIGKTEAQFNFQLIFQEGYELDSITATEGAYNSLKTPADTSKDTEKENVYRLTKVSQNIEVTVLTKEKENSGIVKPDGFEVTFLTDSRISNFEVYKDKAFTMLDDASNYYTRNKDTNEYTKTDGQIKFCFDLPEGKEADVACLKDTYKNLDPVEIEGKNNCYKITKINSDTTVTIKLKGSGTPVTPATTTYDENTNYNDQSDVALKDSQEYTAYWNYSSDVQVSLKFKENTFKAMNELQGFSMPKFSDIYFPADFTVSVNGNKTTYEEVGVRLKGNTSRRSMLGGGGGGFPGMPGGSSSSGNKITQAAHLKISFKATFDDELYNEPEVSAYKVDWTSRPENARSERKSRNLFGMEKVDFKYVPRNSWGAGGCYARELVAFDLIKQQGLLAPNSNICKVTLDNEASTNTFTYQTIECVDKVFLKRHFNAQDAKGDLYKCAVQNVEAENGNPRISRVADFQINKAVTNEKDAEGHAIGTRIVGGNIGVEDPFNRYFPSYQLKTNDDGDNSDFSSIVNLINKLDDCVNGKGSKQVLESVLNMPQFLRFAAVEYMMGNFDDLRFNTNNGYVYYIPSVKQFVLIAYDVDYCLGLNAGKDMATVKPFEDYQAYNNAPMMWEASLLKSGLTYDISEYKRTYMLNMQKALDNGIYDSSTVDNILRALKYPNTSTTESTEIKNFMTSHLKVINNEMANYK